ncbi:MAG: hypothetical protein ACXVBJ_04300 [Flavisolibacter sp.]
MRQLFFILPALISFATALAQDYTVPTNYALGSKDDYARYEKDIIDASKWLVATPLNEQREKRLEVAQFVFKWVNGSPTVSVEITPAILDFEKKNPGMLIIFMASCARYVLENNYSSDMNAKHKAALHEMVTVYKSGIGIEKDKKMEKLSKADEQGRLEEWIGNNMKVEGSR